MFKMYTKEKILSLPSSLSPFPKNLSLRKVNKQKLIISSAHKNCFTQIVTDNQFESDSNGKEVSIEDNKEVNYDSDYIIQLKWLHFKQMALLVVVLHNSIKFYSEENELLLSSELDSNHDNGYGRGIAGLSPSVICMGTYNGSVLSFCINNEKQVPSEQTLMQTQHVRAITDLVSDEEQRLISCDDCGKICVSHYNHNNKVLNKKMIFDGFDESSCNCLALLKNWLCAGYGSGHLRIFDLSLMTLVCEISAHSKWVTGLDVASNAGFILSISEDSFVRVWQLCQQNDSIKVYHRFGQNIVNHMLSGGVFLDSCGNSFCVVGYDSKELHCFTSDTTQMSSI